MQLLKFITCGSVDDGKSTLIGHILYDSKLLYADQEKALELDSKVGSREGKIVLVQHTNFYDADYSGSYSIKQYSSVKSYNEFGGWQHEKIELKPLNSDYNPIIITPDDGEDFRVIGEFVGVIK